MAVDRKTGARALRSIVEESLLDVMYDIPERTEIRKCIITEETIRSGRMPLLLTKTEVDRASTSTTTRSGSPNAANWPDRLVRAPAERRRRLDGLIVLTDHQITGGRIPVDPCAPSGRMLESTTLARYALIGEGDLLRSE